MKREKVVRIVVLVVVALLLVWRILAWVIRPDIGDYTEYKFDVKHFMKLSTTIEIDKSGESYANVKGNIFKFATDPLTMYDSNGNKVAYAGDDYHLIAQASHTIYINNTIVAEMVGRLSFFGETYDIYNDNQEKVARVNVNMLNTKGKMCDADGKIIAVYRSFPFCQDFELRIAEDCELDENTVLMIFSSYYSDYKFDSQSSNNNKK